MSLTAETKAVADAALAFLSDSAKVLTSIRQERTAKAVDRVLQSAAPSLHVKNHALDWLPDDHYKLVDYGRGQIQLVIDRTFDGEFGPVQLAPDYLIVRKEEIEDEIPWPTDLTPDHEPDRVAP